MKTSKKYTKKQICEAIAYWKKQLVAESKDLSKHNYFDIIYGAEDDKDAVTAAAKECHRLLKSK